MDILSNVGPRKLQHDELETPFWLEQKEEGNQSEVSRKKGNEAGRSCNVTGAKESANENIRQLLTLGEPKVQREEMAYSLV